VRLAVRPNKSTSTRKRAAKLRRQKEHIMRKFKWAAYAMGVLAMSCAVTGCETMTKEKEIREATTDSTYCNTAKPIYIRKSDVISDETARQILEHNLTGKALCGWGKKN
jgi:hypothetical protein